MYVLIDQHDARLADIVHASADERLPLLGLRLTLQPKAFVQAFADHALAHIAAMQIVSLEA